MKRRALLSAVLLVMFVPIINAQVTGVWIEDVSHDTQVDAGTNVTVDISLGYSFENVTQISPGVYMYNLEDWVVDDFLNVSGTGNSTLSLMFAAPPKAGVYEYAVNVYYFKENNWFQIGERSEENMSIQVLGDIIDGNNYSVGITDVETLSEVKAGEGYTMNVSVGYDLAEETDVSLMILDNQTKALIIGKKDILSGEGDSRYSFNMTAPDTAGIYSMEVFIQYFNGSNWDSSGEMASQTVTQDVTRNTPRWLIYSVAVLGVAIIAGAMYYRAKKEEG